MAVLSKEIKHRDEFSLLCNRRSLNLFAVEIGVDRGGFAQTFLKQWQGSMLHLVDPWQDGLPGYDEMYWSRESDYLLAIAAVAPYANHVRIVRTTSEDYFTRKLYDRTICFAYIDANHTYEAVKRDIELVWPVIEPGAIMAGHDYAPALPDVIRAVDEFAASHNLTVFLTHEPFWKSWYVYKPKGN